MEHKFKVGDRVRLLPGCTKNCIPDDFLSKEVAVTGISSIGNILFKDNKGVGYFVSPKNIELVPETISGILPINPGGTYMPIAMGPMSYLSKSRRYRC